MSLYQITIPQFKNTLTQIEKWLDAAVAHASTKSFDPNVLLEARLYPDQYSLGRQIQAACDTAKSTPARLTGKEPPKHPDTETTIEQIRARLATVQSYLTTYGAADFASATDRKIELPFFPGKFMVAADYVSQLQLPNFYFHASHAYAILRHNGVPLGKADFIGSLSFH